MMDEMKIDMAAGATVAAEGDILIIETTIMSAMHY